MCEWCNQDVGVIPQACGAEFPMVCRECGTKIGYMDWKELRVIFKKARLWDEKSEKVIPYDELFKPYCFGKVYESLFDCEPCPVYGACEMKALVEQL